MHLKYHYYVLCAEGKSQINAFCYSKFQVLLLDPVGIIMGFHNLYYEHIL